MHNMKNQTNNGITVICIALVGWIFLLTGCDKGKNIPNVDHIVADFALVRSERILDDIDSTTADREIDSIFSENPTFWGLYFSSIIPLERSVRPELPLNGLIRDYCSNPRINAINDSVQREFASFADIEGQLYNAFQYFMYYFPGNKAPNVYTLTSDFGYFPFIFEDDGLRDGVGISLEMFLGASFPYVEFTGNDPVFSDYLLRSYNRDHLVKKTIDVIVDDILGPPPGERLLDLMIHNGKRHYIVKELMPLERDSVIFEFTQDQIEWCQDNERNLWAHYLTADLLYSNEFSKINKLVNYSPNVPGMPAEAPGRVANWSGYRIVSELMRRESDLTLVELVSMRDSQQILELARYRPR
jgi:hypothetical protein